MASKRTAQLLSSRIASPSRLTPATPKLSQRCFSVYATTSPSSYLKSSSPIQSRLASISPASRRYLSSSTSLKEQQKESGAAGAKPAITSYTFEDVRNFVENPDPNRIIIDVREPSELQATGRIPSAINVPIGSSPDFPFLSEEDFEARFELPRPDSSKEVIFYCKAGVRSRAAARLAHEAGFGGKVSEFGGSWLEWEGRGGEIEKS